MLPPKLEKKKKTTCGPSPLIYRKCIQHMGDVHFIYTICREVVTRIHSGKKPAFSHAFPASHWGARNKRRSRITGCWRRGCTIPLLHRAFTQARRVLQVQGGGWVSIALPRMGWLPCFSPVPPTWGQPPKRWWIRPKKPRGKAAKRLGWLKGGLAKPHVQRVQEHCQIRILQEF